MHGLFFKTNKIQLSKKLWRHCEYDSNLEKEVLGGLLTHTYIRIATYIYIHTFVQYSQYMHMCVFVQLRWRGLDRNIGIHKTWLYDASHQKSHHCRPLLVTSPISSFLSIPYSLVFLCDTFFCFPRNIICFWSQDECADLFDVVHRM